MNKKTTTIAPIQRPDGAALIVGLVLLMVLTLLAIASMTTSTTEIAMAQNAQYAQNAFQSAETGIELAIASGNWSTTTATVFPTTQLPGSSGNYVAYDIQFDEATPVPSGFSTGVGAGFLAYHFDVTSTGTSNRGATSTHQQSFYLIGPGNLKKNSWQNGVLVDANNGSQLSSDLDQDGDLGNVDTIDSSSMLPAGDIAPEVFFLFPSPAGHTGCADMECAPKPECIVGLEACNLGFDNEPVRTFWNQMGAE